MKDEQYSLGGGRGHLGRLPAGDHHPADGCADPERQNHFDRRPQRLRQIYFVKSTFPYDAGAERHRAAGR